MNHTPHNMKKLLAIIAVSFLLVAAASAAEQAFSTLLPMNGDTSLLTDQKMLKATAPPVNAFAITPNDGANLSSSVRGIFVGGAGTIKVDMVGTGTAVTFTVGTNAVGFILPIQVKKVYATGTTATGLVGLY